MGRMTIHGWRQRLLGVAVIVGLAHQAAAIYLDEDQHVSLRARLYSQGTVRIDNSDAGTLPTTREGQLVQNRNFFNPELEAKLTSYTTWMHGTFLDILAPDDLSGRLAAWGFYDGIYDYGAGQFDTAQKVINSTFGDFKATPRRAWYLEGPRYNISGKTVDQVFPGHEVQNPRDIYETQRRVNELYFSYSKGPFFLRFGRQAISWGESDTIAILDQNNPFDVTVGAPGIFEDLDEARIPLWTLRSSVTMFDSLGPLSSGFVEGYWVPGDLDVNTGILPIRNASPYSPRGDDPQREVPPLLNGAKTQFVLLDHVPRKRFENSRWGVRLQTVVGRTHTVSAWFYTHFPNAPVPRGGGLVCTAGTRFASQPLACRSGPTVQPQFFTTETVHRMTPVVGASDSFFLEPLDGIVRAEAEYFIGEPSFIPQQNLSISSDPTKALDAFTNPGTVPRANYLRWELGFDRFFFLRALNPSNSFTWVNAFVGSWNLDETGHKDFRQDGQFKVEFLKKLEKNPALAPLPDDFVQQKKVEMFAQTHLQSDYLHGRLTPAITLIANARGTYAILPDLIYRWSDWLLFETNLVHIGGEYQSFGFFKDRDQVWERVTLQLN